MFLSYTEKNSGWPCIHLVYVSDGESACACERDRQSHLLVRVTLSVSCAVCFQFCKCKYRTCQRLVSTFVSGLYPQIGWRVADEIVFVMEGASHDTGSLINWAQQIGNIIFTKLHYLLGSHKYFLKFILLDLIHRFLFIVSNSVIAMLKGNKTDIMVLQSST